MNRWFRRPTVIGRMLVWLLCGLQCPVLSWAQESARPYRDWSNRGGQSLGESGSGSFRVPQAPQEGGIGGREGSDIEAFSKGMALSEGVLSGVTYQIHIVGEVKNPGTYRVTASDRLQEALQRAGGVLERGSLRQIQVRRKGVGNRSYDLLHFRLHGALQNNPYLLDNDVVYVPLRKRAVQVVGAVQRPEIYELRGERTVADAVQLAGGVTVGAERNAPVRVVRFIDGNKEVIEIPFEEMHRRELENGDVIVVSNILTAKNTFDYNVIKLPGDQVFYPSYEDRVFVLGGVFNPGPYPFNPYYSVNHYLTLAGGATKLARPRSTKLITHAGKSRYVGRRAATLQVNPGDTIYVPESRLPPEWWVQFVLGLAQFGMTTYAFTR